MMDLDKLSDKQLKQLEVEYKRICEAEGDLNGAGADRKVVKQEQAGRPSEQRGSRQ